MITSCIPAGFHRGGRAARGAGLAAALRGAVFLAAIFLAGFLALTFFFAGFLAMGSPLERAHSGTLPAGRQGGLLAHALLCCARWFRDTIKDQDLADEAARIEKGLAPESRARMCAAIEKRYKRSG